MSSIMIVIVLTIAFIGLAKRGRGKRRMGRYLRGNVDEELSVAALAAKDVVGAVFDEVVNERTRVTSIEATWSLANFTPIANSGPLIVGVAHGDYTDAEIEEWIEQSGQWNEGNLVSSREVAKRLIRQVGAFETPDTAADISVLNDGRAIKTKLNWMLLQGQSLRIWAFNSGSAAIATTAPSVTINGHVNLFPQ